MYSNAMRNVSKIIFVIFLNSVPFFVFLFLTHTISLSLKCMNDLADGFILRARF